MPKVKAKAKPKPKELKAESVPLKNKTFKESTDKPRAFVAFNKVFFFA